MNTPNNTLRSLILMINDILIKLRENVKVVLVVTELEAEHLVIALGSEIVYPELMYLEIQSVEEADKYMEWDLGLFKPEAVEKFFLHPSIPKNDTYITFISKRVLDHPLVKDTELKDLFADHDNNYVANLSFN